MGSIIFGGDAEPAPVRSKGRGAAPFATQQEATPAPVAVKKVEAPVEAPVVAHVDDKPTTSANRFANGANQNCGNFITDRPTSRVLAGRLSSLNKHSRFVCMVIFISHISSSL